MRSSAPRSKPLPSPPPRGGATTRARGRLMVNFAPPALLPALPEVLLACSAMALLLIGVVRGERSARLVSWLGVLALIAVLVVAASSHAGRQVSFYGMFITDPFAVFMKGLVLVGSAVTILMGMRYFEDH